MEQNVKDNVYSASIIIIIIVYAIPELYSVSSSMTSLILKVSVVVKGVNTEAKCCQRKKTGAACVTSSVLVFSAQFEVLIVCLWWCLVISAFSSLIPLNERTFTRQPESLSTPC